MEYEKYETELPVQVISMLDDSVRMSGQRLYAMCDDCNSRKTKDI